MAELIFWSIVVSFGAGLAAGRLYTRVQQHRADRRRAACIAQLAPVGVLAIRAPRAPQAVRRGARA